MRNYRIRTAKKWIGLTMSAILMWEASGIQSLAAENQAQTAQELEVAVTEETAVSQGDVSDNESNYGEVSANEVVETVNASSAEYIATGTYYGMNWSVDTAGLLTISGTYTGVYGSNDVKWSTKNAENILTAKVTAIGVTSTKDWFRDLLNLQSVDFSEFDAGKVTKMYWMFIGCTSLQEVDLSKFADADVTDLSYMFQNCTSLTKVNFGNLDTSKVTDMSFMFQNCSSLETLDLRSFDTSSVKNMSNMFAGCSKLTSLDLGSFDTQNVTSMYRMFYYCQALRELDLSHFNTSNVTDMGEMFYTCEKLERLNLSGFDMAKVTKASRMLDYSYVLEELWTPRNLSLDVELTRELTTDDGVIYSALPKNVSESIRMIRLKAFGDYGGVKWFLNDAGKLTITGTYGKGFGTTLWTDYKDEIVTVVGNPAGMTSMSGWFQDHTNLKSVDFTGIDTSAVTDMSKLFDGCTGLEEVNLSDFDTGQTGDMEMMFCDCTSIKALDLSSFDTSNVYNMGYMFEGCEALETVDVSHFNTSKVVYMDKMFQDCKKLAELKFDDWNAEKVVTMSYMFANCNSLTSLDFSTMSVANLGDTENLLTGCTKLKELYCIKNLTSKISVSLPVEMMDLAGNVHTTMPVGQTKSVLLVKPLAKGTYCGMNWAIGCNGHLAVYGSYTAAEDKDAPWLTYSAQITTATVSATGVTSTKKWFYNMPNLTTVDLSAFDSSKVTNMGYMFYGCSKLTALDLSKFSTASATNMFDMFYGCSALTSLDLSRFNTAKVTNMAGMFNGCASLTKLDLSTFNSASVTDMSYMFNECKGLTEIVLNKSTFNTAKVTNMRQMFRQCFALENLDVSGFHTDQVTDMYAMFYSCKALSVLDVSSFHTTNVTDMSRMFYQCSNVSELDVSGFDTSKVTDMTYMFNQCGKVTALDMSKFDMSKVTVATDMLKDCKGLLDLNTPKNLTLDVALPVTMIDDSFAEYTALPKNRTASVAIRVPRDIASDKYYGMDWVLKENGYLSISGTYDKADYTGTGWIPYYAEEVISVKVTAKNVESTSTWFWGCRNLKTVDFSEFDASKLRYASEMFGKCSSLEELDLSNLGVSKLRTMNGMFKDCSSLKQVEFGECKNEGVVYIEECFSGCSSLTEVDLSGFDLSNLFKEPTDLFAGCEKLEQVNTPLNLCYDVALPVELYDTECGYLQTMLPKNREKSVLLKKAEISQYGVYCGMDWSINEFGGLEIFGDFGDAKDTDTDWKEIKDQVKSVQVTATGVTDTSQWFSDMTSLKIADFSAFDTSNVTSMYRMFYNCSALTELDVTNFDTSKVTDMSGMFGQCSSLTTLDVSHFDTTNVTDMSYLFFRCYAVEHLDVSRFNTAKVTTMRQMFYECSAVKALDVSGFNTANVTDMYAMFYGCSNPAVLDVSGFDTAKVTNMNRMFWNCNKISALDLSSFDMAAVTDAENMLHGCASAKQIKTPVNLALEVGLPTVYGNGKGGIYKTLPQNMTESVTLNKGIGFGVWCQMDWIVENDGMLYISGSYGALADTDTIWTDYASQVTGVRLMATGVTNADNWFKNMTKLETADLSEFDSSKLTTMNEMFYNCGALTTLDLSGCDFASVTAATEMLYGCTAIDYLYTPKNLAIDVALGAELEDKDRNIYTYLPKELEVSIVLSHVIYRIAPIGDQIYTGKAIKPAITVYKGSHVLTEGIDYTVSYKNNVNAGDKDAKKAPAVTVKGKTNYIGNLTATFTIKPKIITQDATTTPTIVSQNGKVQSFGSAVYMEGKKLRLKKDYIIVAVEDEEGAYKEPGRWSVKIQGINNYEGFIYSNLIILDKEKVPASKLKIGTIPACKFEEGVVIAPEPTVSYKNQLLEKDVDYKILYEGTDKAGKATLTITGLENTKEGGTYVMGSVSKTFTIKGTALSKAQVDYSKTVYYNGEKQYPAVTLTIGEVTLKEGKDYTVEYTKNENVGTGTIILKGCGGYTGTLKKTFKIVADPTVEETLAVNFVGGEAVAYYNAKGAKPEVIVKWNGILLEPGKDYAVSYKNNKKIPAEDVTEKRAPAVVIKGKKNYKFTKTVYFDIVACPLEEISVTAPDKFLGDKKGYLSAPVVKDGTKALKKGKDYEIVSYETADGAVFDGKGEVTNDTYVTVKVQGIGNYTGEESVTYRIATTSISKVKITAKPLTYNGGKPVIYIGRDMKDGLLVLKDSKTKEELTYGEDFRIIGYTNNTKTGTATMTIVGCGQYGGTRTVKFKIVKYKL